ncbi:MAG: transposase [Bdellovibrionaceae bacterium]|nr:transposase [Pseudobdellovibrionaceae bacterium]
MAKRKKFSAEEIINKLRQVEVLVSKGTKTDEAVRQIGVTYQTFLRWRKE